jgi:dihydroxy-acid dehydratase
VHRLLELGIRPLDIMTKKAFENAITVVIALGGSTNAVLHLLAIAHAAGVKLALDDFTRIGKRVPVLADLKPSGKYVMAALVGIGGLTPLMKMLLDKGLLHGDCLTVTGQTVAENLRDVKPYPPGQDIIRGFDNPIKPTSHLVVFYGNLAPLGGVGENHRQGRRTVQRHGARVRFRGGVAPGDPRRQNQEGRRGRDPLRRAQGRSRHAGNAFADLGHLRARPRQRRGAHHRRPLLRRHARLRGGPHLARSAPRRPARAGEERRPITIDARARQLNLDVPARELAKRRKALKLPPP